MTGGFEELREEEKIFGGMNNLEKWMNVFLLCSGRLKKESVLKMTNK